MSEPQRGEVWWGEIEDVGRRPFLVMTRSAAIPVLRNLLAAPITRTVRNIPTELALGPDEGMPVDCAASFDNLRVVPKAFLVDRQLCPRRRAHAQSLYRAQVGRGLLIHAAHHQGPASRSEPGRPPPSA